PPPRRPFDIKVTYEHNHNHNIHSSPSSRLSAEDISQNVRATERFNIPGRSTKAVARSGEEGEAHETATIPALGLRCTVAEIPAPPPLSYTAESIGDLIQDWDSGAKLQIGGVHVPLKYWPDLYARYRGDIFSKRKEVWRQWRELNDWDEFWARYGQEAEDGGGREKCSWTALKANIKKYRSMLDARDVDRAKARYTEDEFAEKSSTVKSGRRTFYHSIAEPGKAVRELKAFLSWRCDQRRGLSGRIAPGILTLSSLKTFWRTWHLIYKAEVGRGFDNMTIRQIKDVSNVRAGDVDTTADSL
ncbi:hypothetical protein Egran_01049, partial [Elaphomyces granulatus]